ncbi:MAG: L,D-transpeptidase family protein [Phycisphaerae bacterium]
MARRPGTQFQVFATLFVIGGIGLGYWMFWQPSPDSPDEIQDQAFVPLTSDRPESAELDGGPQANVPERGTDPEADRKRSAQDVDRGRVLSASGRKAMDQGQLVTARAQLSEALQHELPLDERVKLRADLTRLARQTVLSSAVLPDDPFVEHYTVEPGESLNKIAKRFKVTDDFLAAVNNISDKNQIRAGQRLKVVKGPFHAVVTKADYAMDIYLQGTFIKRFPVGLGAEDGTPTGVWKVKNKLKNPQYYPPRGGQIILADDPENPLGERWIGMEGVEGQALGQLRYGIHGTIEPDSIGKSVSLGCIRMHNVDVEEVYDLLVVGQSKITVK